MCSEAVGIVFDTYEPMALPTGRLSELKGRPGCFEYRASKWDYVSRVAGMFRTTPQQLLLDNRDRIPEPAMYSGGQTLVLCGVRTGPGPLSQLDALLSIKRAIDPSNKLSWWRRESGANGGYCKWAGVKCDASKDVIEVFPVTGLKGDLPDVHSLLALPKLVSINFWHNHVQGTLPADWSNLANLQELVLRFNMLSGTLPASWSGMRKMQRLILSDNELQGDLPWQWSDMSSLVNLSLSKNLLQGSLPPVWSALHKLEGLWLYSNALTGPLPAQWGALQSLEEVELRDNMLSGKVPADQWKNMRGMKYLSLRDNFQLSGCLPATWKGKINKDRGFTPELAWGPASNTRITGFCS